MTVRWIQERHEARSRTVTDEPNPSPLALEAASRSILPQNPEQRQMGDRRLQGIESHTLPIGPFVVTCSQSPGKGAVLTHHRAVAMRGSHRSSIVDEQGGSRRGAP